MKHLLKAMIVAVYVASTVHGGAQGVSTAPDGPPQKKTVVSIVTDLRPDIQRPAEDGNHATEQPLMATGVDLAGKPRRFPAHQTPGLSEMLAY